MMALDSLEQQALDRAARMYASYDRRHSPRSAEPPAKPEEKPPVPEPQPQTAPAEAHRAPQKPAGLLDTLMEDKEQSLILLLLLILMKDGADMNAVLALMYLIL